MSSKSVCRIAPHYFAVETDVLRHCHAGSSSIWLPTCELPPVDSKQPLVPLPVDCSTLRGSALCPATQKRHWTLPPLSSSPVRTLAPCGGVNFQMKSIIFWDVTPCSLLSCNRCFGGTYRLHLQVEENISWYYFLRPWRWRRYVPPKRLLQLNRLHGVTSQKMILFITTAVKTSNLTQFSNGLLCALGII
jgi:hypothetical protein